MSGLFYLLLLLFHLYFIEITASPNQTTELCSIELPKGPFLWDARHFWVKSGFILFVFCMFGD